MAPRVVRAKARRARLQAAPADHETAELTEETQTHPTSHSPSPETAFNASHDVRQDAAGDDDEEQKENEPVPSTTVLPTGDLFHGHTFYLARTLRAERRHELRRLITQNGGAVVTEFAGGAVEIVERAHLKPGENWVAADFVEDSIEHGELQDVLQYVAGPRTEKPQRTPSGRPLKRFFTVDEQATMLRFLHDEFPEYYNKPTVPERIWKTAAEKKLLDRSSGSMHEHYRKQLVRLTKKERAVVFEKAGMQNLEQDSIEGETEGETENEVEQRSRVVAMKREQAEARRSERRARSDAVETTSQGSGDGTESEDEIQGRAKKRLKKLSDASRESEVEDEHNEEMPNEQQVPDEHPPRSDDDEEPVSRPLTPPPADTDAEIEPTKQAEAVASGDDGIPPLLDDGERNELPREEPEVPGGEEFVSYWQGIASSPTMRPQFDRFFVPPLRPSPMEPSQSGLLSSAATSVHRTPQRSRRSSHDPSTPTSHSTPTPQKRRRGGRMSTDSVGTPGSRTPANAAQEELMSQLSEMVGQRMTPPSRRKSLDRLIPVSQATEDDADVLLSRLQLETTHDLSTICSALYWASGDTTIARAFLMGNSPAEIWSPRDDALLRDYMRDDVTEVELANARHRGAFETMSTKRLARDLLRRIQFLL